MVKKKKIEENTSSIEVENSKTTKLLKNMEKRRRREIMADKENE